MWIRKEGVQTALLPVPCRRPHRRHLPMRRWRLQLRPLLCHPCSFRHHWCRRRRPQGLDERPNMPWSWCYNHFAHNVELRQFIDGVINQARHGIWLSYCLVIEVISNASDFSPIHDLKKLDPIKCLFQRGWMGKLCLFNLFGLFSCRKKDAYPLFKSLKGI